MYKIKWTKTTTKENNPSDGGLGLQLQYKLVRLGVDVLFTEFKMRDRFTRDHQAEVRGFELELSAMTERTGDRRLADQRPLPSLPALSAILQCWPSVQITLQKCLEKQHLDLVTNICTCKSVKFGSENSVVKQLRYSK